MSEIIHHCPNCNVSLVMRDDKGEAWVKQHCFHDCIATMKQQRQLFEDALKKTQIKLADVEEKYFELQRKVTEIQGVNSFLVPITSFGCKEPRAVMPGVRNCKICTLLIPCADHAKERREGIKP